MTIRKPKNAARADEILTSLSMVVASLTSVLILYLRHLAEQFSCKRLFANFQISGDFQ